MIIFVYRHEDYIKFDKSCVNGTNPDGQNETANDKEEVDLLDLPSKCVDCEQIIHIASKIVHIDFEGRSDGESLKQIILSLRPRRLLLVRGSALSTKTVSNFTKVFSDSKVFAPKVGQCLNVTTESHIYQVQA